MDALIKSASLQVKISNDVKSNTNDNIINIDVNDYDYGQLAEIIYAIKSNVDNVRLNKILNNSLTPEQMRNIWYYDVSKEDNINTIIFYDEVYVCGTNVKYSELKEMIRNCRFEEDKFNNIPYDKEHINLIKDLIERGLNAIYLFNIEFNINQATSLYNAVCNGINPSKWCDAIYSSEQMDMLNFISINGTPNFDIIINPKFSPRKMELLSYCIKQGENIDLFLDENITDTEVHDIMYFKSQGYDFYEYTPLKLTFDELFIIAQSTDFITFEIINEMLIERGIMNEPMYRTELFLWIKCRLPFYEEFSLDKNIKDLIKIRIDSLNIK